MTDEESNAIRQEHPDPNARATISVWSGDPRIHERLASILVTNAKVILGENHKAECECSIHIIDSPDTATLIQEVHTRFPGAPIIATREDWNGDTWLAAARAGAKGLLTHEELETQLLPAMKSLTTGGYWIARHLFQAPLTPLLTRH